MIAPSLIHACNVYAFGAQCHVKAWKQPLPSPAKQVAMKLAKDLCTIWSEALAQHLDDMVKTMPVSSTQYMALATSRPPADLVTAATFSDTSNKQTPPSPSQVPGPSKKKKCASH